MKKPYTILAVALVVALAVFIGRKEFPVPVPQPGSLQAKAAAEAKATLATMAESINSPRAAISGNTTARAPFPLVDRNQTQYHGALDSLDNHFLAVLRHIGLDKKLSEEQLITQIRLLSQIRLSQAIHEVLIAEVDTSGKDGVVITIPAYPSEGESLRKYLIDQISADYQTPEISNLLWMEFSRFGKDEQKVRVGNFGERQGERMFQIEHRKDIGSLLGPLVMFSQLTERELGAYAPFAALLPKS